MSRPLIFVSCGAPVAPLLPALATRWVLVVPDAGIARQLRAAGYESLAWHELADPARVAAIRDEAPRLPDAWMARLELADVAWGFGARERRAACLAAVRGVLERTLATQLLVAEFARALVATGRLAGVVLHEDVTPPVRALLAVTQGAGVPSLHLPHGVYARERLVGADVHGTAHADVIAVGGPAQRAWFLARGVAADRIVVTGNPAWDRLCGVRRDAFPPLHLPPGPVVTVATSWIGGDSAHPSHVAALHARMTDAALDAVARVRAARPEVRLVLRPHPSAPRDDDERLVRRAVEAGAVPDRVDRGDATALLARSAALVTLPSSLAVEAVLVGTPVVATAFGYEGEAVRSADADGAAVAAALDAALDDRGPAFAARCADFAARYNGPHDGRAGERVVALLDDLVGRAVRPVAPDRRAAGARAELGLQLLERGEHARAEALLRDAAALDARSDLAWCGLGVLAALRGDREHAVPLLRRALALNPANRDARDALAALTGAAAPR